MRKPPLTEIVIDAGSDHEIRYWASELGVPAAELRMAIYAVGTRVTDVRAYLDVSEVIPFPRGEERMQSRSA
jgi:hypothetical protein